MNPTLDILQGELERLFTMNELLDLCRSMLGFDPEDFGGSDIGKAAFVRRLVDQCEQDQATIALADAVQLSKSGMVDPRLKQVYNASYDPELELGTIVGSFEIVELAGSYSLGRVYWADQIPTEITIGGSAIEFMDDGADGSLPKKAVADSEPESAAEEGEGAESGDEPAGAGETEEGQEGAAAEADEEGGDAADDDTSAEIEVEIDEEEHKRVRIEVVSAGLTPDARAVRRYITALRAATRVEHPSLPKVLEVGVLDDGRPWVALEVPEAARPYSELIAQSPRTISEAWPVIEKVMDALVALHEIGLAHGDVKPENVLVAPVTSPANDAEGEGSAPSLSVCMIGMGCDRLFSRPTRDDRDTGPLLGAGTPKCMAPEQARGKGADRRTDLYGLGAFLYETLTGRAVFTGRSGIDIVAKHLTEEAKPPSAWAAKGMVSPELDEVVLQLLVKDGLRRPNDLSAVAKSLATIAEDEVEASQEPEGTIEDAQAAVDLFLEDPDEERCDALEEAARAARAWEVASEAYEHALDEIDDDELTLLVNHRLARIYAVETKEPLRAEKLYKEILEKNPDDLKAEAALENIKRSTGKHEELIEMLLQRAEKLSDPVEKAATFREVAQLYETNVNQPDQAFTVLLAALQQNQDEEVLDSLARLAGDTGRWNDLVQAASSIVQEMQDPPKVVLITTRMGRWYGEMLGRQDYALPCYQQALAIDPSNDEALTGMEEIFKRQQQWLELSQVLLSRAEAALYPGDKRNRCAEAAAIFADRLSDHGRAVELYKEILTDDPAHEKSVAALERIHIRTEDWQELVSLYRAKDEALTDLGKKVETRYDIAEVFEDRLNNDNAAIAAYKDVLELDGSHIPTLKGLERLYARTGAYRDLLDNLRTQMDVAATPRQRVSLYERRAQILEEEFVERDEALEEYSELLSIDPDNEEALTAVARLQRALERWDDLDQTYERHVAATEDKERRVVLLNDWSKLLIDRLENPSRAADVLAQLATVQPGNVKVLDGLAKQRLIYEDIQGAIDALVQLADVIAEGERRANVWVRVGELYERKLEDHEEAEAAYRKALDADKTNVIAAAALQERYAERGDMTAALDMLERQLDAASGDLERSRIYTEMGSVCREKLSQPQRAVEYYEKALECDKSNSDAAEPLAEIHSAAGRWDAAVAIYDRFSDATASMSVEKKLEFFEAWGEANMKLGDYEKAEKAFAAAVKEAPDEGAMSSRLADVYFRTEAWKKADIQYGEVLSRFGDEYDEERRIQLLLRRGIAQRRASNLDGAGESLDAVLELHPEHREALRERAEVNKEGENWEAAAEILQRLANATDDEDIKIEILTELGDLYTEELVEHEKAADSYASALTERPDDRNLLMRLMKAYSSTKQWSNLVEVVLKIADMETDTVKMARYYQTAAMIAHRELGRTDEAREYYETAIEQDPSLLKSFEALTEILTEKEEWEELAEQYRTMLNRLPEDIDKETKIAMYDALGGVLQNQLEQPSKAIEYLEKANQLDPNNRPRKEALARLYRDSKEYASKAIPLHHQLLTLNPFRAESYRSLRRIYAATEQWDKQWCCARTLVSLHMAEEDEEELYKQYKLDEIPTPRECLTDEQWQNYLLHKEQDRNITSIFETIMPAVLQTQARLHKTWGVDAEGARNLDTDDHPLSQLVKFSAATLGMEPPQVFFGEHDLVTMIQTNPPALLAGGVALMEAYKNPRGMAFLVGRQLAYARGGNMMRLYIESGTMMRAWLLAALKHVQPRIPIPQDMAGTVGACGGKLMSGLGPVENESLRGQVLSFIESAAKVNLKQWATAVDFGVDRVGFLLCDDLEIASQLVRADQAGPVPVKDRLKELNLFSVHPEYFALRKKLLIQLWPEE